MQLTYIFTSSQQIKLRNNNPNQKCATVKSAMNKILALSWAKKPIDFIFPAEIFPEVFLRIEVS